MYQQQQQQQQSYSSTMSQLYIQSPQKRVKSRHLIFRLLCCLLSSPGLIWQIISISEVYFEYQTRVDIDIESPIKLTMPALTICLNIIYDEAIVRSFYPNETNPRNLNNLPVNVVASLPTDNVKIVCQTPFKELPKLNPNRGYECENYAEPLITIQFNRELNRMQKCTTYFYRNVTSPPMTVFADDAKDFFAVDLFSDQNITVITYVHNHIEILHNTIADSFSFATHQTSEMILSSSRLITNLLPAPYRTECLTYDETQYGRMGCIFKCLTDKARADCNTLADLVPADPGSDQVFCQLNGCCDSIGMQMCNNKNVCPAQCLNRWYTTTLISIKPKKIFYNVTRLFVRRPLGVEITYSYAPRLAEIEFICYIASCFGIWFGFSFLGLMVLMVDSFNNRLATKKSRVDVVPASSLIRFSVIPVSPTKTA